MNDSPSAGECSEADRGVGDEDDPERNLEPGNVPGREQHPGDDPHGLLGIIGAVIQAEKGGRHQLRPPEPAIDARRRHPSEQPHDGGHQRQAQTHADERRQHDEDDGLGPARRHDRAPARLGHGGTRIPADQRVRRARRQAKEPGDQIPHDRAAQTAEDHGERDDVNVDHAGAHGPGHGGSEGEGGDEIEERRPDDGLAGREHPRRHHGGD